MEILSRFLQAPKGSFFLLGPRGTGKSTFCRERFPDAVRIDLLEPDVFRTLSARPERLREIVTARPERTTFVVDEIQKIPALLDAVHALIEEKRGWRFVLTGSSARKIRRAGVDLLAGRAVMRSLHPFMASEWGPAYRLENSLTQGLLPLVIASPDPADVLRSYAALYVREEVQMEGLVRNVGNFSRFLEAVSFSHGSVMNLSAVARDCEVERKTVEGYLDVLLDLLLAFQVPVFGARAKRRVSAHPKFYFFDAGVFRSLRPSGPLDRPQEIDGQALEGLVAQHLRAWIDYGGAETRLFFWRTRSGTEVDFVLYGKGQVWAFEVKNTDRVRTEDLSGLRAFKEDFPISRTVLLYRGQTLMKRRDTTCVPLESFLRRLRPGVGIPHALSAD